MMKRSVLWAIGASLLIIYYLFALWLSNIEWHLPLMPLGVRASPGPSVLCMVPTTYRTWVGGGAIRHGGEVNTLGKYVSGYLTRINVTVQPESVIFALKTTDGWEVNTLMTENVHSRQRMDRTRPIMVVATYNKEVAFPRKKIFMEIMRPVYVLGARIGESHFLRHDPLSGDLARVEILPRERETLVVTVFTTAGESWNVDVPGPAVEIVIHEENP